MKVCDGVINDKKTRRHEGAAVHEKNFMPSLCGVA
jgi:hypothetical protein